ALDPRPRARGCPALSGRVHRIQGAPPRHPSHARPRRPRRRVDRETLHPQRHRRSRLRRRRAASDPGAHPRRPAERRARPPPTFRPRPAPLMKKILILGVNGFIGHHLSKRILAKTDWEVFGMDMSSDRVSDLMADKRFHFFEGDITINREWIEYHIRKCDVILPLVAIATPATYVREPLRVFELDFEANLPIVRSCVKHGHRILFPSPS